MIQLNKLILLYIFLFISNLLIHGQESQYYFSKNYYISGANDSIPVIITTYYDSTITVVDGDEKDTACFQKKKEFVYYKSEKSGCFYKLKYNTQTKRLKVFKTTTKLEQDSICYNLLNFGYYKGNTHWDQLNEKQIQNWRTLAYKLFDCGKPTMYVSIMRDLLPRSHGYPEDYYLLGNIFHDAGMKNEEKQAYENYLIYSAISANETSYEACVWLLLGNYRIKSLIRKYSSEDKLKRKEKRDLKALRNQKEGHLIKCYYVDERGKKIHRVRPNQIVYVVLKSKKMKGRFINIDFYDESIIYEYQGRELTERMIEGIPVLSNKIRIELKAIDKAEKIVFE